MFNLKARYQVNEQLAFHARLLNVDDKEYAQEASYRYGYSADQGIHMSVKQRVGDYSKQAAHPDIYAFNNRVDIVWLEYYGQTHQLWHKISKNNGESFQEAKMLSNSPSKTDRPFIIGQGDKRQVSWQIVSNEHRLIE